MARDSNVKAPTMCAELNRSDWTDRSEPAVSPCRIAHRQRRARLFPWLLAPAVWLTLGWSTAITPSRATDEPRPRSKFNRVVAVGDAAPEFDGLLGIDGKRHRLADCKEAKVVVVMFIRNLCPTTHEYEPRLRDFAQKFFDQGVELVAISVSRNPAEGLDRMAVRAKAKGYTWAYLQDESQFTGRVYGATVTPQFFVLDGERKIAYMGAFDDNVKPEQARNHFVADAVTAVLEGKTPKTVETLAKGCEIEYARDSPAAVDKDSHPLP